MYYQTINSTIYISSIPMRLDENINKNLNFKHMRNWLSIYWRKTIFNQFRSSSIYIQCIIDPEKSEAALYNCLQNMKKHYQIRWFDDEFDLLLRHDIIQFKLVYKNDITAFDLWIWGYMKWNGLVSNFVLIKNNLHWTLICCILKRDTCNKFGVKICACRARTKKCDINEKKYLKYKVNGSQFITI